LQPLAVALHSLSRTAPCLAGLGLILLNRQPGRRWWLVVLLWSVTAASSGVAVAAVLLPGLASALLLALPFRKFCNS
ncbi:MAG: hypothetical protein ACRYFY_22775, partial [Janthinobacterium lividum]